MKKDLKRQLNQLKKIQPNQNWVASTKTDILGEERVFFFEMLQPKFAFGSLACFCLLMFLMVFNSVGTYPEVTYSQNKITPRIATIVNNMKEDEKEIIMAINGNEVEIKTESEPVLVAEINFDNLSEAEKRRMIRESTDELLAEINQLEEQIIRVMAMRSGK